VPPADVVARARRLLELALGDRDDELRPALFDLVSNWPLKDVDPVPVGPGLVEPVRERIVAEERQGTSPTGARALEAGTTP